MRAVTIKDPFKTDEETTKVTVKDATHYAATYLAQARWTFAHLPRTDLAPDPVLAAIAKGQLAADIGRGYAELAELLAQDHA